MPFVSFLRADRAAWSPLILLKVVSSVLQVLQKPVQELLEAGPLHHADGFCVTLQLLLCYGTLWMSAVATLRSASSEAFQRLEQAGDLNLGGDAPAGTEGIVI